jgi:hypothetical protein
VGCGECLVIVNRRGTSSGTEKADVRYRRAWLIGNSQRSDDGEQRGRCGRFGFATGGNGGNQPGRCATICGCVVLARPGTPTEPLRPGARHFRAHTLEARALAGPPRPDGGWGGRRCYAPVAQLDRVSASGAEGRRFESCRARQPSLATFHQRGCGWQANRPKIHR